MDPPPLLAINGVPKEVENDNKIKIIIRVRCRKLSQVLVCRQQ